MIRHIRLGHRDPLLDGVDERTAGFQRFESSVISWFPERPGGDNQGRLALLGWFAGFGTGTGLEGSATDQANGGLPNEFASCDFHGVQGWFLSRIST